METFRNSKEVNKAHYDYVYCYNLCFFILSDIWSAVENYFQKILNPPLKNPLSPFYSHPPRNSKSASPLLFANIENGGKDTMKALCCCVKISHLWKEYFSRELIIFTVILFLWFDKFLLHKNFGNNCIDDHETKMYELNLSC